MGAASDSFEEHLNVLAALKDNYAKPDDARKVAEVVQLQQHVQRQCGEREEEVKNAIRALSQRVNEVEGRASYPEAEGAHAARVAELASASGAAKENVGALNTELQALQGRREQLKAASTGLAQRSQAVEEMVNSAEPQTRHHLSLYAHISKITWQFEARARVAGVVSDPDAADIRPFSFDPDLTPAFDITNALWDLMDGAAP
eukprot:scaffold20.g7705.t1